MAPERRFEGRVQQPLVRLFREGWEEDKPEEASELKQIDALAWSG